MFQHLYGNRVLWLGAGLVMGLAISGVLPHSPAHATASSQLDNLVISTGAVDGDGEAVFILDALSGDLMGWVINPNNGAFTAVYKYNVLRDLGVDPSKSPKYVMVTGTQNFRRGAGGVQMANSVIYVAELTTGKMLALGFPWNRGLRNSTQTYAGAFVKLDLVPYRELVIRETP